MKKEQNGLIPTDSTSRNEMEEHTGDQIEEKPLLQPTSSKSRNYKDEKSWCLVCNWVLVKKIVITAFLWAAYFICNLAFSTITPFFPKEVLCGDAKMITLAKEIILTGGKERSVSCCGWCHRWSLSTVCCHCLSYCGVFSRLSSKLKLQTKNLCVCHAASSNRDPVTNFGGITSGWDCLCVTRVRDKFHIFEVMESQITAIMCIS